MNLHLFCLMSLLLFFPAESQPYSSLQVLTGPSSNIKSFDISNDNQIIVSFNYYGIDNSSISVYVWDKTNFTARRFIRVDGRQIRVLDLSGDG